RLPRLRPVGNQSLGTADPEGRLDDRVRPERSPYGAQRNPGTVSPTDRLIPGCATLHQATAPRPDRGLSTASGRRTPFPIAGLSRYDGLSRELEAGNEGRRRTNQIETRRDDLG